MRAVVDRIEGDIAILLLGDEEIKVNLPRRYLPAGTRESSILTVGFQLAEAETAVALDQAAARIERLKTLSKK